MPDKSTEGTTSLCKNAFFDKHIFLILAENHYIDLDNILAAAWNNITRAGYMLSLKGTAHLSWLDTNLLLDQMLSSNFFQSEWQDIEALKCEFNQLDDCFELIDSELVSEISSEYILAFYDAYLKNASTERISTISYPEAMLEVSHYGD